MPRYVEGTDDTYAVATGCAYSITAKLTSPGCSVNLVKDDEDTNVKMELSDDKPGDVLWLQVDIEQARRLGEHLQLLGAAIVGVLDQVNEAGRLK